MVACLKGARIVVVSDDIGTGKRHFRFNFEEKTGSGGIRKLEQ